MADTQKILKDLDEYQKAIEQTKQDVSKDQGILQSLQKQLKELTETEDIQKSEKIVAVWEKELESLEQSLIQTHSKMKEMFPL